MNEDERIKKLIRSNVSGPGHSDLFVKETDANDFFSSIQQIKRAC